MNVSALLRPGIRRYTIAAAIALLVIVALVVALSGRGGPPVIRVSAGGGERLAAADQAAPEMGLWRPVSYTFELADSAWFDAGSRTAWRMEAPRDLRSAAERLAAGFGLDGLQTPPRGADGYLAGTADGSGPSLWVGPNGEWYFNDPGAYPASVGCAEPGHPGEGAGDVEPPDATEDREIAPDEGGGTSGSDGSRRLPEPCLEPTQPTGVPTAEEARAAATALFARLDLPLSPTVTDAHADDWGAWVTAAVTLDRMETGVHFGVGFGAEGAMTWANGTLARPVKVADYPTVDASEAVARLGAMHEWGAFGGQLRGGGTVAADVPVSSEAVHDGPADEEIVDDRQDEVHDDQPDVVFDDTPEEMVVLLVSAEQILSFTVDADGTVWLLPAVRFTDADGGEWQALTIEDGYVEFVSPHDGSEPGIEPLPVDPPVVDPGEPRPEPEPGEPAPGPMDRYEELAREVVGMPEDEAIARIEEEGAVARIVRRDGEHYAVTDDLRFDRINLAIENGRVVEADVG